MMVPFAAANQVVLVHVELQPPDGNEDTDQEEHHLGPEKPSGMKAHGHREGAQQPG
jgi:hypothetical protein